MAKAQVGWRETTTLWISHIDAIKVLVTLLYQLWFELNHPFRIWRVNIFETIKLLKMSETKSILKSSSHIYTTCFNQSIDIVPFWTYSRVREFWIVSKKWTMALPNESLWIRKLGYFIAHRCIWCSDSVKFAGKTKNEEIVPLREYSKMSYVHCTTAETNRNTVV